MKTNVNNATNGAEVRLLVMCADSAADLPSEACNADVVYCINGALKGKFFVFDETAASWVEQPGGALSLQDFGLYGLR